MQPYEVDTENRGRCKTCHGVYARDAYAPCNLHPERAHQCGGACHAKRDLYGDFKGFCGPLEFDEPARGRKP